MRTTTRLLTGSLAALAVASTVTLAGPAFADESPAPCGQPATPAVYLTVIREGVRVPVPAVTHDEWRWERAVTTYEHEYSTVVREAYTETDWTRELPSTTEYRWSHLVIDQEAVPAVPASDEVGHWADVVGTPTEPRVEYEYQQQQTGKLKWMPDGWNGDKGDVDKGQGWAKTGRARQWVVEKPATPGTPALDEVSHLEYTWSTTSPGVGWTGPVDTRTTGGGTETATTTTGHAPAGEGWVQVGAPRTVPAVVDTVWALEAPEGYTATGASRVRDVTVEQTDGTSAIAPAGDGWSPIPDSRVVVVDQEASTVTVGGSTEQVLVSPAQDATPPCPEVAGAPAPATDAPAAGHVAVAAVAEDAHAGHAGHTVAAPQAAPATVTVLPATGSPVSPLMLATGLGALLTGGALVRSGRRRTH